jgi:hypothetical protein
MFCIPHTYESLLNPLVWTYPVIPTFCIPHIYDSHSHLSVWAYPVRDCPATESQHVVPGGSLRPLACRRHSQHHLQDAHPLIWRQKAGSQRRRRGPSPRLAVYHRRHVLCITLILHRAIARLRSCQRRTSIWFGGLSMERRNKTPRSTQSVLPSFLVARNIRS